MATSSSNCGILGGTLGGSSVKVKKPHPAEKQEALIDIIIKGPPGIGKKELAVKYIHDSITQFQHIIWINADDIFILHYSMIALGERLHLQHRNFDKFISYDELLDAIYRFLNRRKVLFIFQNAKTLKPSENYDGIFRYLPQFAMNEKFFYIVTTEDIADFECKSVMDLGPLKEEDSFEFFKEMLDLQGPFKDRDVKLMQQLGRLLKCYPLAMRLAASYLQTTEKFLKGKPGYVYDFIKEIYQHPMEGDRHDIDIVMKIMLDLIISAMKSCELGSQAFEVFLGLAYLEYNKVPKEFVTYYLQNVDDRLSESILELLEKYFLIDVENYTFNIHKQVQKLTREMNTSSENDTLTKVFSAFMKVYHKQKDEKFKFQFDEGYFTHMMNAWNIATTQNFQCEQMYELCVPMIQDLIKDNLIELAAIVCNSALKFIDRHGNCDQHTLTALQVKCELVNVLFIQEKYTDALQDIEKVIANLRENFTTETEKIVSAELKRIQCYGMIGDHIKAFEFVKELTNLNETEELKTKINIELGNTFINLGRYAEALLILEHVNDGKTLSPKEALEVEWTCGRTYLKQGRFADAAMALEVVHNKSRKVFGENEHITFLALHEKNTALLKIGKNDEAFESYECLRKKFTSLMEWFHPFTSFMIKSAYEIKIKEGKYEEAMSIFQEAKKNAERELGDHHPFVLQQQKRIAKVLFLQKKYELARNTMREVILKEEHYWHKNHPNVLATRQIYAQLVFSMNSHDEAIRMLRTVIKDRLRVLGECHTDTIESQQLLSYFYKEVDKVAEAERILRQTLRSIEFKFGASHEICVRILTKVAEAQEIQNKIDIALESYKAVLTRVISAKGEKHIDTLQLQFSVARCLKQNGDFVEEDVKTILQVGKENLAVDHPFLVTVEKFLD